MSIATLKRKTIAIQNRDTNSTKQKTTTVTCNDTQCIKTIGTNYSNHLKNNKRLLPNHVKLDNSENSLSTQSLYIQKLKSDSILETALCPIIENDANDICCTKDDNNIHKNTNEPLEYNIYLIHLRAQCEQNDKNQMNLKTKKINIGYKRCGTSSSLVV